ncbi:MAG: hypothetical protein Greene071421_388 [Parcubacteria group bacterium Greene0714_21]|nr:MAG: hypothetical protein Greene041639_41 [Parcubacteria group bacterium Greene0416_39]TSC98371.1 MAG: hypothetical protein Greene101447_114 [Parcubacteria group bacterium Greene1014_47]TSD04022.1 MAG: hypothetical protein Greene071421_388 [Parcubacteria group bacterium Greene0714_21]
MKKLFPLFAIAFLALALLPSVADAGLIPCGGINPDGTKQSACGLCHIFVLGGNIINFFLLPPPLGAGIVPIVATILIVLGGFLLMTAGGDPTRLKKAGAVLTAVVVGLIIIYASGLLLGTLFTAIGVSPGFSLKSWTDTASWCPVKP